MDRVLQITSPISWVDVIVAFLMLSVGSYNFIESPSVLAGIFILVFVVVLIFLIFLRDEVRFDASGAGIVVSRFWTFLGVKKYKYEGLSKAKMIVKVDIGGENEMIEGFLIFDDGYGYPISGNDTVIEKIILWFQNNYNTTLSVKKEKISKMREEMRRWQKIEKDRKAID